MAFIYKISNSIDDKVYVGLTSNNIEYRFKQHLKNSENLNDKKPLYTAMRKYGKDKFKIELLEETDIPGEREKYWIKFFDSYKNGYNASEGGEGCYRQVNKDKILFYYNDKNMTIREICFLTGHDHKTIESVLNEASISHDIRKNRAIDLRKNRVAKVDLQSGEILEIYNSASEAEKKNGIGRHVGSVCLGKRKSAGGFGWKYI